MLFAAERSIELIAMTGYFLGIGTTVLGVVIIRDTLASSKGKPVEPEGVSDSRPFHEFTRWDGQKFCVHEDYVVRVWLSESEMREPETYIDIGRFGSFRILESYEDVAGRLSANLCRDKSGGL